MNGRVASLLAAVLLALAANPAGAAQPGEAVMAWHVTLAPTWFDPSTAPPQITPFGMLYAIHDAMVRPLPGAKMGASLAESWRESPDGLTYEFKLRPGLKFHNGAAVRAREGQTAPRGGRLPERHRRRGPRPDPAVLHDGRGDGELSERRRDPREDAPDGARHLLYRLAREEAAPALHHRRGQFGQRRQPRAGVHLLQGDLRLRRLPGDRRSVRAASARAGPSQARDASSQDPADHHRQGHVRADHGLPRADGDRAARDRAHDHLDPQLAVPVLRGHEDQGLAAVSGPGRRS